MWRSLRCWIQFFLLFGMLFWVTLAFAGDGTRRWKVMDTPHFKIYFHQGTYDFALRVARLAEEAHKVLVPYAAYAPVEKTHVIIYNDVDHSNGSATALPRNVVTLFTAPPDARDTLNDSDDWLRGLVYHEYLHILNLDTMSPLFRMVNKIFGKRLAPNMLMPRWWVEGWAVCVESSFTGGGRNQSSLFDMYLRTAVLGGQTLRLDQVSNGPLRYPRGSAAYLYGSRFLFYLIKKYGKSSLTKVSHFYGKELIPYGMNAIAYQVFGKSYGSLWKDWMQGLKLQYTRLKKQLSSQPTLPARRLTQGGEWIGTPLYLPGSNDLLYVREDGKSIRRLERYFRKEKKVKELFRVNEHGEFGLDKSGLRGILAQTDFVANRFLYGDLYTFSPSGSPRQVTHGMRAKDPDLSPDGKFAVFVRLAAGRSSLWLWERKTNQVKVFFQPKGLWNFSRPRFSPDGKKIVCSVWFPGGARDIILFDRKTAKMKHLTKDRAQDLEPSFSPDGLSVLYSSDMDGVYNLYQIHLKDHKRRRLTNELSGAFAPVMSPDGRFLAFVRFGLKGYDLFEVEVAHIPKYTMPKKLREWSQPIYKTSRQIFPVRTYKASKSLFPIDWFPVFSADYLGSTYGFRFSGQDVLGFHSYRLSLGYGTTSGSFSYRVQYNLNRFVPSFYINNGIFSRQTREAVRINGQKQLFPERVYFLALGSSIPWNRFRSFNSFNFGYELHFLEGLQKQFRLRPADIPPKYPDLGFVHYFSSQWFYSNIQRSADSISNEEGRSFWLRFRLHRLFQKGLGGWDFRGIWSEYFSLPFLPHHVLALRFEGGLGQTTWRPRRLFFLGGIPAQDLLQSAIFGGGGGATYLRGYPSFAFAGDVFLLAKAEYRFPILNIERGLSLAPFMFRRLYGAFFVDTGRILSRLRDLEPRSYHVGVGGELRLEWIFGYALLMTARFGFAKGLTEKGLNQFYIVIGSNY